ncbi:MAG: chemotaxis protein CheW [Candidatus Acidiferrales bacterium]
MKIASQEAGKTRRARHAEQMILFAVANRMFAIAAESVQEIRSTDSLAGSANEIDHSGISKVRHTLERSHQTYYVVNAGAHFGLPVTRPTLVLILRKLRVAVLIDRIERMAEIAAVHALPRAFNGDERRWYLGLTYVDDHVIPVIQPSGFLTADEFRRLDFATASAASQRDLHGAVRA